MNPDDYHVVAGEESVGEYGVFGVKILINQEKVSDKVQSVLRNCKRMIESAVMTERIQNDPKRMAEAAEEKRLLLECFGAERIYVQEEPNLYCSDWCCKHRPWFGVTTPKGRIEIGWRKRVISIDWTGSDIKATAEELFAGEQTTKGEQDIHAWGYEKAKEYVQKLLAWEPAVTP